MPELQESKTIRDFGRQWTAYSENEGYYGSTELFLDAFPMLQESDVKNKSVVDVGSGTGRIVQMLLAMGAKHVYAIEPSTAFHVLEENLQAVATRVTCLNLPCEELRLEQPVDLVVSYGVFHHIPDPHPAVDAAFRCLKPGGIICLWLYGKEGNELYLSLVRPLRSVSKRLPHSLLSMLCWLLYPGLVAYVAACRLFPLPLRGYMNSVIAKLNGKVYFVG